MTTPTNDRQTSERERPEFTLAEAIAVAERNADAYENVPSVSRTLLREIAALRAENEALRTVTDRNVHDALNAYDDATGEGWQLPCAQGMRAALQSFIRSKESRRG